MLRISRVLSNEIKLIRTFCHSQTSKKPPWSILFFGADDFSLYSLKALFQEYRRGKLISKLEVTTTANGKPNPIRQYAEKGGLKLHKWPIQVQKDSFDVGLVVSFGHLIPADIIDKFQYGMLNVHASLLPRWRGAAPIIYALANGDPQTGITIMRIRPKKFDVGEIVDQATVDIPKETTMPELHEKLGKLGAQSLVACLEDLPEKLGKARKQPEEGVTYAPKIGPSFGRISWHKMTSEQIYNLCRAATSLVPHNTNWRQVPVKLLDIETCPEVTENKGEPGFVEYDRRKKVLRICCSDQSWITVKRVKVYGKKVMTAADFNNGYLKQESPHLRFFE